MDPNNADPAASASYSSEPDFKLGDWWVRPQRNELDRAGETAHVEARSMGVLVCLARHAPRVVSRQRLLDEVWSDSPYVGEEAISHAIWELRKVLGDSAREPVYIQTVSRKGYVLLVEIVRPRGSPLPIAGARIDHYDIREELGRGSMGVVFKAFDRRLERTVAIKFLAPELTRDQDACRRFLREAQLAAALDHPNLATVHAIGETSEGQHYLVTPFYAGGSLKAVCARGDLTLDGAVRFAVQLARGLAAAHAQGIVHRDIKPANLLIDEHGTLKIADFGIAKLLGATDLTRTGVSLGTPAYKSPEQARGGEIDHRSDIWSMGVVLFEMLTGRRPFDGEFEQAVVHAILTANPVVDRDVRGRPIPEPLRRIVAKAMAREPGERYQRAEEVVGELEDFVASALVDVRTVAARPNALPGSSKQKLTRQVIALTITLFLADLVLRDGERFAPIARASMWLYDRTLEQVGTPDALLYRGSSLYEQRRWHDARRLYHAALSQSDKGGSRSPATLIALGDTYSELGEPKRARGYYSMALRDFDELVANPKTGTVVRAQRAICAAKLGRFAEAEAEVPALLDHADTDSKMLVYAARIAALAGDREALWERSRRAIEAGHSIHELTVDAAFRAVRHDPDYLAHLERSVVPGASPGR